jgi:hypothetical protein
MFLVSDPHSLHSILTAFLSEVKWSETWCVCIMDAHVPVLTLSVSLSDPMGEEHYTGGAPWIPTLMVVVRTFSSM